MTDSEKMQKVLDCVSAMRGAMIELSEIWAEPTISDRIDDLICRKYPFKESLEEICFETTQWQTSLEQIQQAINNNQSLETL